ncbi:MAG: ThuA domain-containing protein [Rhodothermales bacterium]
MQRRAFLKTTAAAATAASFSPHLAAASIRRAKKALFVYGGWPGHKPEVFMKQMVPVLEGEGFDVVVSDALDSYADADLMATVDVVIQQWTMSKITNEQANGLLAAIKNGTGMAGWHGGMGDAFREHTEYQFMTGGQFVSHPGGQIDYTVNVVDNRDPIMDGIGDFEVKGTEQYYMHVDPNNHVLATTRFTAAHNADVGGAVMPVIWKRRYGKGRVFYNAIGHNPNDFDTPEVMTVTLRGIHWASQGKDAATPLHVQAAYGS